MDCIDKIDKRESLARALKLLQQKKVKLTAPRRALLEAICGFTKPFSADELFSRLRKPRGRQQDLVTVYRNLATFEEVGVLNRCDFSDGIQRFELSLVRHHHHVICTSCKAVEPISPCKVLDLQKLVETMGYQKISHHLEFFGICPNCA